MKVFFLIAFQFLVLLIFAQQTIVFKSPLAKNVVEISLTSNGTLQYSLRYKNKVVIQPSTLGFELKNAAPLSNNFEIVKIDSALVNESWKPV